MGDAGRAGLPLRAWLGAAGALALLGPVLVALVVGWAAGLIVSLLVIVALLAGGWWLIRRLEALTPPGRRGDLTPPAPLSGAERGEPDVAAQPPKPETRNLEPTRVLLVEDDPVTQRIVARLLGQLGAQVEAVGDGQAAVDTVAARMYALVLMDCQLPIMDGYAAAAEIRRREAVMVGGNRLPIVALTASESAADRERALAAGMDDLLTKPLDRARLSALLAHWRLLQQASAAPLPEIPADGPPILDPAGLPTVNGRLSEPYREIVALYRQEAARRMRALSAAAALPDRAQVASIAHTLAGSSSSLGGLRMAAACAALETLAKAPPSAPAHPSAGGHADSRHAGGDSALAGAVEVVRRELERLDAALAHLTVERPAL